MRLLRHDFRRYYGASFDSVPVDEAIDLIATLPAGSLYVSSVNPARSWSELREVAADVQDTLAALLWRGDGAPPRVSRPSDAVERMRAAESAKRARAAVEETEWEEV